MLMDSLTKRLRALVAVLAVMAALPSCATAINYSAESIEAWVVDAETGAPVEGAVVVAHWQLMGGMEGGNIVGQVMVLETVTDAKGRFHFPAWGPVRHSGPGRLDVDDPELIIFKSGYKFLALANDLTKEAIEFRLPPQRKSKWNGKTIPMKYLGGDLSKVRDAHSFLGTVLNFVIREPRECDWKKVPQMIVATAKQEQEFRKSGMDYASALSSTLIRNDAYFAEKGGPGCGSPIQFLRGHGL
jgi:hypothetical protein